MGVLQVLREALENAPAGVDLTLPAALADAERLADQFAEVRPQTYIVPIEKFAGLPVMGENPANGWARHQR